MKNNREIEVGQVRQRGESVSELSGNFYVILNPCGKYRYKVKFLTGDVNGVIRRLTCLRIQEDIVVM